MAGRRYFEKLAILAKRETTYGLDAAPTGAANAIQTSDATLTPLQGQEVSRDLLLPYLGQQGVELVGNYASLQMSVEIAGAGAAGTVPAYAVLLKACGMVEAVEAGVSVKYLPISGDFDAASIYFNRDGVRHVLLGARGTVTMNFAPNQIPRYQFTMTGLLGTITDAVLPTVDLTKFIRPAIVTKANTTLAMLGWNAVAESISFDLANQIEPRFLIGDEAIELVDRNSTGSAVVEARSLATVDWFDKALRRTRGPVQVVHGKTAGNIVQVDCPAVEVGRPTEGNTQKILNYTLPLMLCPVAGNDEFVITVK